MPACLRSDTPQLKSRLRRDDRDGPLDAGRGKLRVERCESLDERCGSLVERYIRTSLQRPPYSVEYKISAVSGASSG